MKPGTKLILVSLVAGVGAKIAADKFAETEWAKAHPSLWYITGGVVVLAAVLAYRKSPALAAALAASGAAAIYEGFKHKDDAPSDATLAGSATTGPNGTTVVGNLPAALPPAPAQGAPSQGTQQLPQSTGPQNVNVPDNGQPSFQSVPSNPGGFSPADLGFPTTTAPTTSSGGFFDSLPFVSSGATPDNAGAVWRRGSDAGAVWHRVGRR